MSSVTNYIAGTVAFVAMSVVPVPHIHGNWIVDVHGVGNRVGDGVGVKDSDCHISWETSRG